MDRKRSDNLRHSKCVACRKQIKAGEARCKTCHEKFVEESGWKTGDPGPESGGCLFDQDNGRELERDLAGLSSSPRDYHARRRGIRFGSRSR